MTPGIFLISLDFELYWGVRDHRSLADYGANILGVRQAVPALLEIFKEHGVHATWATVGFVFFDSKGELVEGCPSNKPAYINPALSPYGDISTIGNSEHEDPWHYGRTLIEMIRQVPGQEIGTHTFSHYYCQEPGQDQNAFRADLSAAVKIARKRGIDLKSLVFPRNQTNPDYLNICEEAGMTSYRGTEAAWYYARGSRENENRLARAMRLADSYINLSGSNTYPLRSGHLQEPINLPASRFLRPFNRRLKSLESLRLSRIRSGIEHAARNGEIYHLWWHPHNFGANVQQNMAFLQRVLDCFLEMRDHLGMESLTMEEAAARARHVHG